MKSQPIISSDEYWNYALNVYGFGQIQALCLTLQDEHRCNVNVLLFCCYLDALKIALKHTAFETLNIALQPSELELHQHRILRRNAKQGPTDTYESLKQDELTLERKQQKIITETMQSFIAIDAEKNNNFASLQSNLLVYASVQASADSVVTAKLNQLILDLKNQHQSFIQTENDAK